MAEQQLGGLIVAAAVLMVLCVGASAQSSSCTSAIVSLSPCLNYITGQESTPSSSCCSQLASVVRSEPKCLCTILNGGASSSGININQSQALALPGACRVQTPPVSQCNTKGGSSSTPSASSPSSPSAPSVPSGGISEILPTDSSDGSLAQISLTLIISLVFIAAYSLGSLPVC